MGKEFGRLRVVIILAAAMLGSAIAMPQAGAISVSTAPTPRLKPPPPPPVYATRLDLERLRSIKDDLDRKRFSVARAALEDIEDPIAKSLGLWFYFYADDPQTSFGDARAFLDNHANWPALTKIQSQTEELIDNNTSPDAILSFFDKRDPVTGGGKLHLARALLAKGERDAAHLHIRDAWVNDSLSRDEERDFLAAYGSIISADDHAARVDRLLWSRQVTSARRYFGYLKVQERRRAEARANLLLAAKGADTAYDRLPAEDRLDPGVLNAAVRYFRRADNEPRAIMLARLAPSDPVLLRNPSRWWDETQLLMRWALKERLYADAYTMAAKHGLEPGEADFAEAEFNAGWIALRFLGDAERAETHFAALAASVGTPISLARGYYWIARAKEAQGEETAALDWYEQAAEHIYTYYGQLAAEKIGGDALARRFSSSPPATEEEKQRFASRPTAQALGILSELGDERGFLIFGYSLDDQLESRGEFLELAALADRLHATHITVRAGKVAVRADAFAPEVAYPLIYVPDEASRFAPAEIILGLSRQESEFNPRAYSRAGARGLMQLLPSTAQLTARKERIPYRRNDLLNDPLYNMTIGAAHLSHLFERYDGSYIMTFAAYNAGPHRVTEWIDRYGDPRSPIVDPVDWVEQIPFAETRNYVQRVLENSQVYRSQLSGNAIAGKLAIDLERGGPSGRTGSTPALTSGGNIPEMQARVAALAQSVLNPPAPVAPSTPPTVDSNAASPAATQPTPAKPKRSRRGSAKPTVSSDAGISPGGAPSPVLPVADNAVADNGSPPDPTTAPVERPAFTSVSDKRAAPSVATEAAAIDNLTQPQQATTLPTIERSQEPVPMNVDAVFSPPIAPSMAGDAAAVAPDAEEISGLSGATEEFSAPPENCNAYLEFLADASEDEASAADLNAGALAQLEHASPGC